MRTELSEAEGWRDLAEQRHDVDMLDASLGVRIVFTPEADELVKMVGAKDGPITGQVVEVVHDDGDEQVEDEEGADDEERDKVRVGEVGAAPGRIAGVLAPIVADHGGILLARQHDFLPGFTCRRSEEDEQGLRERLEVVVSVDVCPLLHGDFAKHLSTNWIRIKVKPQKILIS